MNKFMKLTSLMIIFFSIISANAYGQRVYEFSVKDEIGPGAWYITKSAYTKARAADAQYLLMELNTFGGAVNFADSIRTLLLNTDMKTIVYINNNAASAGALISLATDHIFMHSGASLGAATVVDGSGEVLPEKYQSYMRGLMRATAEAKGRNARMAEAFVDPSISVPSLKEDGKLLTLTASESVKAGLADAEVKSTEQIYEKLGITNPEITVHQTTLVDRIIGFLINPLVSGFLIMGIIGGIYMELQTPGLGFAGVLAVICGGLFFAPLYLQGLADHWEILIFVIGVILMALEVFVIPGFGVAGILGIILMLCGLAFSMVANDFLDFQLSKPGLLMDAFLVVVGAMVLSIILIVIFGKNVLRSPAFRKLVLADEQLAEGGYTSSVPKLNLINQIGVAKTVLRPSGKIEIEGNWYEAVAMDGFIDLGEKVCVIKHENYTLFVRKYIEPTAIA
ncbi:NfeD family protein [Sphingobacterium corticibacter]|uniref:Serine protease n=1 Tax=Sphingobacterium corticibacter TaxID=2171749 RepID=A0A2T8HEX5_9SPHI|nr:NfeD family protein [Sphingobacterium corticibacter]PVH23988.1 serine protease [Sphingobacterium corticibacter]